MPPPWAYTINVANDVASTTITPTAVTGATVTVAGTAVTSGTPSGDIPLNVGANAIAIVVTAADGTTEKTYTVTVRRVPLPVTLTLAMDTGASPTDRITSNGQVEVTGLVTNAIWRYTINGGSTFTPGTGTSFTLPEGDYTADADDEDIQVVQSVSGVDSVPASLAAVTVDTTAPVITLTDDTVAGNTGVVGTAYTDPGATATDNVDTSVDVVLGGDTLDINTAAGTYLITYDATDTAGNGAVQVERTVTVTEPASTDADLASLAISAGTLPAFDADTISYAVNVGNDVASVMVTPTTADTGATLTIDGTDATSGTASAPIPLTAGVETAIVILVTAEDGSTEKTYTLTMTRAAPPNQPPVIDGIDDLNVVAGTLVTLTFHSATDPDGNDAALTYRWTQAGGTPDVTLSGADTATATFTAPSNAMSLSFRLTVTDEGGASSGWTTNVVTGSVTPAENTAPSITGGQLIGRDENGDTTVATYTATDAESDTITWSVTGADAGFFTIAADPGNANLGVLTFNTVPDFETQSTYSVTIVATDDGEPNMSSERAVTVTLENVDEIGTIGTIDGVAQVGQTLTAPVAADITDPDGAVVVTGHSWSGAGTTTNAATYAVVAGDLNNTITVTVTYTDGQGTGKMLTSAPTAAVLAESVILSADADLASLTISAGTLPAFAAATTSYAVDVDNDVASVMLTPTTSDTAASVTVAGTAVTSATASSAITLNVGANAIAIVVTAQNGTEKTYTVTIDRGANTAPRITTAATQSVAENTPTTTPVVTFAADDDESNTITWALTGADAGDFTLNAASGALTLNALPNYETKRSYAVTVTATDNGTPNMPSAPRAVTIAVTNVDEEGSVVIGGDLLVGATLTATVTEEDGAASLTYQWQSAASGGTYTDITSATSATYILAATDAGKTLQVVAMYNDGFGDKTVTSTITGPVPVAPVPNQPPVANAGDLQTVAIGATVTLDGSGSTDSDGTIATYAWVHTSTDGVAPTTAITVANGETSTFTAPDAAADLDLVFTLTVTDDGGATNINTDTNTVTITVTAPAVTTNQPPVANAGDLQTVAIGATVTLDGSGSTDSDGTIQSYEWVHTTTDGVAPTTAITVANGVTSTFTAPDAAMDLDLVFTLTVTDDDGATNINTDTNTVTITVTAPAVANIAPTADAGDDFSVTASTTGVTLTGVASTDSDGTIQSYEWVHTSTDGVAPTTAITVANGETSTFTAPDTAADLVFTLTVTDDDAATHTDMVTITVTAPAVTTNQPPVANAGADQSVTASTTGVTLDGTASTDSDGTIQSYVWVHTSTDGGAPATAITVANGETSTFTAPDAAAELVFTLTVTDDGGATNINTDTNTVTITVTAPAVTTNQPPVANAGADQSVTASTTGVTLDGTDSTDSDGTIQSYEWVHTSTDDAPPATAITVANGVTSTFTAPDAAAELVFTLTVTDDDAATHSDMVTITVTAPVVTTPFAVTIPALGKSTVGNSASVGIDFARAVTGLETGDFSVSNGAVNSIDPAAGSGTEFVVTYTPSTAGAVTLTLAANAVTDGDGNPNSVASATGSAAVAATQTTSKPSFTATTTIAGITTAEFDEDKFELGIATLLSVPATDVRVLSIAAGSVVVEYEVAADTVAARDTRAMTLDDATDAALRAAIDQNIPSNAVVTTTSPVTATPDTTAPEITLLGASPLEVNQGTTFTDPGATANDNVDGGLSADIVVGGDTVDTDTAGDYTITYDVSDDAGNAAETVTRIVRVVIARDLARLNEVILPEVARAMAEQNVSAITQRLEQARLSTTMAGSASFGGASSLADIIKTQGRTVADDQFDLKRILAGSDFVMPLNANGARGGSGGDGGYQGMTFWGAGDYRDLKGADEVRWGGDFFSLHLGLDAQLSARTILGVSVSSSQVRLDYTDPSLEASGDYDLDMTSVHPYLGWTTGGLDFWATAGYGEGELEISENGGQTDIPASDLSMQTFGVGASGILAGTGLSMLRLKTEILSTELEVDASEEIAAITQRASRLRLALEATRNQTLSGGGRLESSLEVGARQDSGDGETGAGAELGGSLLYTSPGGSLTMQGKARVLVAGKGDAKEWGLSGVISLRPSADGSGLSFSLTPGYGVTASSMQQLWQQGLIDDLSANGQGSGNGGANSYDYSPTLDVRLDYGMNTLRGPGLLTPYTEMSFGDNKNTYRLGLQWQRSLLFELKLVTEREESAISGGDTTGRSTTADHRIYLEGELHF